MEDLLIDEINFRFKNFELFSISKLNQEKGGVILDCPLGTTEYLLKYLKCPTKIQIDLYQFKVTDFPKLFKKIESFNWSKVMRYPQYKVKATCSKSRLIHSDRVKATVEKAIERFYQLNPPSIKQKESFSSDFYYPIKIRIQDDQCKVSIDISQHADGTEFYKKSLKIKNAKASIRENIAFCLIFSNVHNLTNKILIDPMAGAGTIPLMVNDLPNNKEKVFDYLKYPYNKLKRLEIPRVNSFQKIVLNDIDPTHFNFLKENFKKFPNTIINNKDFKDIKLIGVHDLFSNLPYGKRIKINKKLFLSKLFKWLKSYQDQINSITFIAPFEWQNDLKSQGFRQMNTFENGGVKVSFFSKINH